jgi:3-hydroxybutyryl-CoA dehydrogenase
MGPFELMDLTGIDVTLAAATGIWEGLGRPDRLRPSPIQEELVAAGDLGRKTGQGFYRYADGKRIGENERPPTSAVDEHLSAAQIRERVLDAITVEAELAGAEGLASTGVIDLALRLGAGHPRGPFESRRSAS